MSSFAVLRWLPVRVSKQPVETIVIAILMLSLCFFYLQFNFRGSLLTTDYDISSAFVHQRMRFLLEPSRLTDTKSETDGWKYLFRLQNQNISASHHFRHHPLADRGSEGVMVGKMNDFRDSSLADLIVHHIRVVGLLPSASEPRGVLCKRAIQCVFELKNLVERMPVVVAGRGNTTIRQFCENKFNSTRRCLVFSPTSLWNDDVDDFNNGPTLDSARLHRAPIRINSSRVSIEALLTNVNYANSVDVDDSIYGASSMVLTYAFNASSDDDHEFLRVWKQQVSKQQTACTTPAFFIRKRLHRQEQGQPRWRSPLVWWDAAFVYPFWTLQELLNVSSVAFSLFYHRRNLIESTRWWC